MSRLVKALSLSLLITMGIASRALALPAPMSDDVQMNKSDVVALVRVLAVACTSVTTDKTTGEDLPGYLAKLQVIDVKKGDVKSGDQLMVTWRAVPTKAAGAWTVNYYPGEAVWTHLVKRSGGIAYASTWWNAKGKDVKPPETTNLPTQIGQSVVMTGTP
jgi:hypothetical protein